MAFVILLACIAALLYLIHIIWNRKKSTLSHPKGIPVFGNLFQFNQERPALLLTEWARELGPIFRVRMLHKDIVALNDCDVLHEALVKKGRDFAGRPFGVSKRAEYLWEYDTSILANNPCPQWKFLRNTVHTNIKMYSTGQQHVESINMAIISDLVRNFKAKGTKIFNPKNDIFNAVMNIICVFLVGKKYYHDEEVFKLFREVERQTAKLLGPGSKGSELDAMWWLRHFGNSQFKKLENLRNMRRRLWALVKKDLKEREKSQTMVIYDANQEVESRGIVGLLLDALRETDEKSSKVPSSVTEKTVMLTFHDLIFAGTTSTANSFYAFLNIIAHYPEVQHKLTEEVDQVIGDNRMVSLSDKSSMPYTRALILELLRYSSIVPLGVSHSTIKDTELKSHFIPKGTMVVTNLWAMHHDEQFWKDPFVFCPERFLDSDGDVLPADHVKRKHLMPFSAGARVCLGESLALGRLFLLVATMAQMFTVKPGDKKVSCDPRGYETGTTISQPEYELRLLIRNDILFT